MTAPGPDLQVPGTVGVRGRHPDPDGSLRGSDEEADGAQCQACEAARGEARLREERVR